MNAECEAPKAAELARPESSARTVRNQKIASKYTHVGDGSAVLALNWKGPAPQKGAHCSSTREKTK